MTRRLNEDEIDALLTRLHKLAEDCDLEDRIDCFNMADAMRDAITMIEKLRNARQERGKP